MFVVERYGSYLIVQKSVLCVCKEREKRAKREAIWIDGRERGDERRMRRGRWRKRMTEAHQKL